MDDNGYDISDYYKVDPMFGTNDDMDRLLAEAGKRGMKVILDLVVNHCSDEHEWFVKAKQDPDCEEAGYFYFRKKEDGGEPNNWRSNFGGSVWTQLPDGRWYFHTFSKKQPDLNWENPKLRKAIYDMINWWIDRGVGGFRLDVIDLIGKDTDNCVMAEGPMLHPYIREMSSAAFQRADLVTVGEAWSATPERAFLYSNPDGSELSMVFQFEHMLLDQQPGKEKWDLAPLPFVEFKKVFTKWQQSLYQKGWNSLFLDNHDLPRAVSHFGNDEKYRVESAKMLATMIHGMQGTPYIYQGEELGMTNVRFDIEEYRDIELLNMYKERMEKGYEEQEIMRSIYTKGRDNARTPMQWDESPNAGFTAGTPWIRCNPNYTVINAQEALVDQDSVFHYYQKLIALRKQEAVLIEGWYEPVMEEDTDIFAYTRENGTDKLLVLCNFKEQPQTRTLAEEWKNGEVLISNYPDSCADGKLRPYEAMMIKVRKG